MSNLIPEKRVNKHGVAVTKHVRAGTTPASKTTLPAPAITGISPVAPVPTAANIIDAMWERKKELSESPRRQPSFGYEQPFINKFPDELRQSIHAFIKTANIGEVLEIERLITYHSDEPNRFRAFINTIGDVWKIDMVKREYDVRRSCDDITRLYDSLGLANLKGELSEYHFSTIKAEHVAAALRFSPKNFSLPHEYYREVETIRQNIDTIIPAISVLIATENARVSAYVDRISDSTLTRPENEYQHMTGDELVGVAGYVQQHPEHTETIIATVKERGEFDRELIDTMVASGASAVASGTL